MIHWITCREFVGFLDDYLAGRITGVQLDEFNSHLAGCPPCVTYMHTYRDAIGLARAALAEDLHRWHSRWFLCRSRRAH
mgnify:CR=1 FL=1